MSTSPTGSATPGAGSPRYGDSGHYDQTYFDWQDVSQRVTRDLYVPRVRPYVTDQDVVLDFGCAGGWMLDALPGRRKIGVEINDVARDSARSQFGIETYRTLDDTPGEVADVIVSSHTLEHLASPYDALEPLRRKLRPGGRLVLLLPLDDWRVQARYDPDDFDRHLYTWTPRLLGNLLDEAGWTPGELRVLHRATMRGFERFLRLPRPLFEAASSVWSRVRHRQEILAVSTPKVTQGPN